MPIGTSLSAELDSPAKHKGGHAESWPPCFLCRGATPLQTPSPALPRGWVILAATATPSEVSTVVNYRLPAVPSDSVRRAEVNPIGSCNDSSDKTVNCEL